MEAHKLQNKMSGYLEEGINFFFQLIHFFLKLILGWYGRSLNCSSLSILSIPICFLKKWPIFKKIPLQTQYRCDPYFCSDQSISISEEANWPSEIES